MNWTKSSDRFVFEIKNGLFFVICAVTGCAHADNSVKNYISNILQILIPNSIYVGDNPKYQGMFGMVSGIHQLKTLGCPKYKEAYVFTRGRADLVKFENNASDKGFALRFQEVRSLDKNFSIHPFRADKADKHVVGIFLTDSNSIEIGLMICDI